MIEIDTEILLGEIAYQEWINTVISILGCASTNTDLSINKFVDDMQKSRISKKAWDNCEDVYMKNKILNKLNENNFTLKDVLKEYEDDEV